VNTLVVFHADHHVNDVVGLCPPEFGLDVGTYQPSAAQRWLWRAWLRFWEKIAIMKREYAARVLSVFVGDVGDINAHSSNELVTINDEWIVNAMVDVAKPALDVADKTIVIRGTAAHSGGAGKLEELFAQRVWAEPCRRRDGSETASWYVWRGAVDGVDVLATHHPASGSRLPDKLDDACNRSCAFVAKSIERSGGRAPDWCVWGHVHKRALGTYLAGRVRGVFLPPWKLVGNYGYRLGTVIPEAVGGFWLLVEDGRVTASDFELFSVPPDRAWEWR
jgi:hypothetical protein